MNDGTTETQERRGTLEGLQLAADQAEATRRLARRPAALADWRKTGRGTTLLLQASTRTWRRLGANDLAATIDTTTHRLEAALESRLLDELEDAGNCERGNMVLLLERLSTAAEAFLSDALDLSRFGGCRAAGCAPRSDSDRRTLAEDFAAGFALDLEFQRLADFYAESCERCPTCGAALALDPKRGPFAVQCFSCGPMPTKSDGIDCCPICSDPCHSSEGDEQGRHGRCQDWEKRA